jgi:hypothetical protein
MKPDLMPRGEQSEDITLAQAPCWRLRPDDSSQALLDQVALKGLKQLDGPADAPWIELARISGTNLGHSTLDSCRISTESFLQQYPPGATGRVKPVGGEKEGCVDRVALESGHRQVEM